jgi:xylose isomerase
MATASRALRRAFGVAKTAEHFPNISKLKFEGPATRNPLSFAHYNADEVVMGKTMRDWLRFSVCYWHTFRGTGSDPFGGQTLFRPWDDSSTSVDNAIRRADAAFEFFGKLGAGFYSFHDVDVAPQGKDLRESNANLDKVADHLKRKQEETGVKLAWGTANLFSHPRYACGAATNPDAHVFAYAAAQVKKAMEVTHRLGGQSYVFWGGA